MNISRALELHLVDIDWQHERLFELQRLITVLLQQGADAPRIRHELEGLRLYARLHFDVEERFFRDAGYPAEAHEQEHGRFLAELDALLAVCEGDPSAIMAGVDAAGLWLQRHILADDMQYVEFLRLSGDRRQLLQALDRRDTDKL